MKVRFVGTKNRTALWYVGAFYKRIVHETTKTAGGSTFPPVMALYTRPNSVQNMVDQSVMRIIHLLDMKAVEREGEGGARWTGF
ncbi:uncharacterized protein BKA55DRAFT_583289, partial [Fusarium redolens]